MPPSAACGGAFHGHGEFGVFGVGPAVGVAGGEARDAFDAGGDEHVSFSGADGVQCHAGGLQRRRAVAVHGDAGNLVQSGEDGDDSGHVEAGLAAGLSAAQVQVVDVVAVEFGDLVQDGLDHLAGELVGPDIFE